MRLRTYLLTVLAVTVVIMMFGIALKTKSVLRAGFDELKANRLARASQNINAIIKAKREYLQKLVPMISNGKELRGLVALAIREHDRQLLSHKLGKVQTAGKFDLVQLVFPEDPIGSRGELLKNEGLFEGGTTSDGRFSPESSEKNVFIICSSPIEVLGEKVALVLGYSLTRAVEKRIADLNGTDVKFLLRPMPHKAVLAADEYEMFHAGRWMLIAQVTFDEAIHKIISARLNREFFLWGSAAVILLLVIIYLLLEQGFLREFKTIIEAIDRAAGELDRGILRGISAGEPRISENRQLAQSFQKFAKNLSTYDKRAKEESKRAADLEKSAALASMAEEVVHDIRGPLSSLDKLLTACEGIPDEERGLIRNCIARAIGVAEALLSKSGVSTEVGESRTKEMIAELVDFLVLEKNVQYVDRLGIRITFDLVEEHYGLFSEVKASEFKRAIANLIDNSVEAMALREGEVWLGVGLTASGAVKITVRDSGAGIPAEILSELGKKRKTFGKERGSGLGLHYAMAKVEEWGGTLKISSVVGIGTEVTVELPLSAAPDWFCPFIDLKPSSVFVVVDDDPMIYELWKKRTAGMVLKELLYFPSLRAWEIWFQSNYHNLHDVLYLCDQEFRNEEGDGLLMIKKLAVRERAILITGSSAKGLRIRCCQLRVRLLPKRLASIVAIRGAGSPEVTEQDAL